MIGEHPELDGEARYEFGCAWYTDHGPYFSDLQIVWIVIGLPCMVATTLALASTCGLACITADRTGNAQARDAPNQGPAVTDHVAGSHYGPLIGIFDVDVHVDASAEDYVHRWVRRGAAGAIGHGVLLAGLGWFIALHANNEMEFTFLVDASVALAMVASKAAVASCALAVHRHLSPLARDVAGQWTLALVVSKALMALCALVLACVYLALAVGGVDANRGDGTRRILQEHLHEEDHLHEEEHLHVIHGPTPDEQAQLCAAGFAMLWSFLVSLISQSVAGFAFFRIYANAVRVYGDTQVFSQVVGCWWGVLVIATCGVGIALWLGAGIMVFPVLDISPLRMMGLFYFCAAASQILAGVTMTTCNSFIRSYYQVTCSSPARQVAGEPHPTAATVVGVPLQ